MTISVQSKTASPPRGRTGDLTALLRSLALTYTHQTGTRASAVIDRIEQYLDTLPLSDHERGVLNVVAAGAGLGARRSDWIENASRRAVPLLRTDGSAEELAAALTIDSWMTVFRDFERAISMLEEARSIAERAGSSALADVALAYEASHHAVCGRVDESLGVFRELEARLGDRAIDYAGVLYDLFLSAVLIVREPGASLRAIQRLGTGLQAIDEFDLAGVSSSVNLHICSCAAHAATGDVEAAQKWFFEAADWNRSTSNDDGLPDLLLPPAALAVSLGHHDRARRWLTAVRHAPKPTKSFQLTIIYQRLRAEVGLQDENPLEAMEIQDVYAEAIDWMKSLDPVSR